MARNQQKLIAPTQALEASYTVLQRSASSVAGKAVSKLAARFAAGNNELAQLVRKDQDLTAEAVAWTKVLLLRFQTAEERNASAEDQIRKRIEEIKSKRENYRNLQSAISRLCRVVEATTAYGDQTQALLADDEALVVIDLDDKSYVWVITKDRAEWKELTVNGEDVNKAVKTLRMRSIPRLQSLRPQPCISALPAGTGTDRKDYFAEDAVVLRLRWGTNQSASAGANNK